ncbi:MAG: hypothetical protein NWF01_07150 [Candidatus Bathyarchaeota archaeon]|nr:hypothetical protein [Candidatus Bathyarchaeota archaeon]
MVHLNKNIKLCLLGICLILPIFFTSIIPITGAIERPSSYSVELESITENGDDIGILSFTNGSFSSFKNLKLILLISEIANNCTINFTIQGDSFSKETTAEGYFTGNRLLVDSVPSIFVISPDFFSKDRDILLTETNEWQLVGNIISRTAKPLTAIDGQYIKTIMVESFHVINGTSQMPSMLGFDPKTGILVYAGASLSDVILKEMGIDYIRGGIFRLTAYSKNLNFELITITNWLPIILALTAVIAFLIAVIIVYKAGKRNRKSRNQKPNTHKKRSAK